jgi:hypothetical protein
LERGLYVGLLFVLGTAVDNQIKKRKELNNSINTT